MHLRACRQVDPLAGPQLLRQRLRVSTAGAPAQAGTPSFDVVVTQATPWVRYLQHRAVAHRRRAGMHPGAAACVVRRTACSPAIMFYRFSQAQAVAGERAGPCIAAPTIHDHT